MVLNPKKRPLFFCLKGFFIRQLGLGTLLRDIHGWHPKAEAGDFRVNFTGTPARYLESIKDGVH